MSESIQIDYEQLADAIASRLSLEKAVLFEWIHIDKAADLLGVTKHVLKGWFENHLKRGVHYQVVGHQTLVNTRRMNEWMNNYGAKQSVSAASPTVHKSKPAHKVRSPHRLPKK